MKPEDLYDRYYRCDEGNQMGIEESTLFQQLQKNPQGKLLDVGCGSGEIAEKLTEMGFSITGADHSQVAIGKMHKKGLDARLVDFDADGLNSFTQLYDAVYAGDILEHVFDPINLLKEIYRVLKPNGRLYLSVPNEFPFKTRCSILIKSKSCQSFMYRHSGVDHHHTHFSEELLRFMLKESSLVISFWRAAVQFPFFKKPLITKSRLLGREFGAAFIIVAEKTNTVLPETGQFTG